MAVTSGEQVTRAHLQHLFDLANANSRIRFRPYQLISPFYPITPLPASTQAELESRLVTMNGLQVGDYVFNQNTALLKLYKLTALPSTTLANWQLVPSSEVFYAGFPTPTEGRVVLEFHGFTPATPWDFVRVWHSDNWYFYRGWLSELNRLAHEVYRALEITDPARTVLVAGLSDNACVSGPWTVVPGFRQDYFLSLIDGGHNLLRTGDASGFLGGHTLKEMKLFYSDDGGEVPHASYRIQPQWSYKQSSGESTPPRRRVTLLYSPPGTLENSEPIPPTGTTGEPGVRSGFTITLSKPAKFDAWVYLGGALRGSTDLRADGKYVGTFNLACSHPEFVWSVLPPVFSGSNDASVNYIHLKGEFPSGTTEFWIESPLNNTAPASYGRQVMHGDDPQLVGVVPPQEPLAFAMDISSGAGAVADVLHPTKVFRTIDVTDEASSYPLVGAADNQPIKPGVNTGKMWIGFNHGWTHPGLALPQYMAGIAKTYPRAYPLNLAQQYAQFGGANAKSQSPTVDDIGDFDVFKPVQFADQNIIYPYPCIKASEPQPIVTGGGPTSGGTWRTPMGMIYKVTVRRPPTLQPGGHYDFQASGQPAISCQVGCVINGGFRSFVTVALSPTENAKTVSVQWPTFGAPVAYSCAAEVLVFALMIPCASWQFGFTGLPGSNYGGDSYFYQTAPTVPNWISKPMLAQDYNDLEALLGLT